MTFSEVKALNAQIVLDAWVKFPEEGWEEITADDISEEVSMAEDYKNKAKTAVASRSARRLISTASAALKKARQGSRVFRVQMINADWAYAATPAPEPESH